MQGPAKTRTSFRRCAILLDAIGCLVLAGCHEGIVDPKGQIASAEQLVLVDATGIMLAVVVPVILMTIAFAWWFRDGNKRAKRQLSWSYSGRLEVVVWAVPALVILFLGGMAWVSTHRLDPPRPIASAVAPIDIEVVSLDWKWLFIYPGQGVASVNSLVVPTGTPVRLKLTSASVMNSFMVPQLAGQIYTMHAMTTRLNLVADHPGVYKGLSSQFSGDGFSDMSFQVTSMSPSDFVGWVERAKQSPTSLDATSYGALLKPSSSVPVQTFAAVQPGLFAAVCAGQAPPMPVSAPSTIQSHPR